MTAMVKQNYGDLSRTIVHETVEPWPQLIEIVAYFGPPDSPRKGRRKSIEIPADQFFGRGAYGAPMDGAALIRMIDSLRRA